MVEQLASSAAVVYFDRDRLNSFMFKAAADGLGAGLFRKREAPLRPLLHEMRLTKSPAEAALMRRSAQVAAHAMRRCMEATRPGVTEYQLAATFGELRGSLCLLQLSRAYWCC